MKKTFALAICLLIILEMGYGKIVMYSSVPQYGQVNIEYKELTIIAESENDENKSFRYIRNIVVDSMGHVYLLDYDRIIKYDSSGNYVATIGKKGQGPGEYTNIAGIYIDSNDRLNVLDGGTRIVAYDINGRYFETRKLLTRLNAPFFTNENKYTFGFSRRVDPKGVIKSFLLLNENGEIGKEIEAYLEIDVQAVGGGGGGVMGGVKHPFSPESYACELRGKGFFYGMNLVYEISFVDDKGTRVLKIINDENKTTISSEDKKRMFTKGKPKTQQLVFPEFKPYFGGLVVDGEGRLYVVKIKLPWEKNTKWNADVYNKEGRFLFKAILPYKPECFLADCFYAIDNNEDKGTSIKKINILNYAKLPR